MQRDFWLTRWERGETGWHLEEFNPHLEEYWPDLGIPENTTVLVPLCGKSLDLLWLASRGHKVVGVELSEDAIVAFCSQHSLEPQVRDAPPFRCYEIDGMTLLCGDFFDLTPEHLPRIDAVFDRASLIALPPEMRSRYAGHLKSIVPTTASSLLITLEYDQTVMAGPPFSVSRDEVETLFGDRFRIRELQDQDAMSEQFARKGLSAATERVYWLEPE